MSEFKGKTAGRAALHYPFGERVPDMGETIEIMKGIYWVRMPLPFALKWINLYLIDDGEKGWTVIDTGMPLEETKSAWRKIFDETLGGRPIWRVIITHMHPDHIGNAGWISRKFPGCELWITRLEYVSCRMLIADTGRDAPEAGISFYRAAGWQDHHIEAYKSRFGGFGRAVSRLPDSYKRLSDGDTLQMAGHDWSVITGSGHSPEHACLYCEDLNVFLAGDQLLPKISSNVSVFPTEPLADPLRDWIESCAKLRAAVPDDVYVLPGHNEPFKGARDRLQALIHGHEIALKRLKQRLQQAPRRAVDVFPAIFGRKIGDDLVSMATGEAIAHLNCLVERGDAVRETRADGITWYHST